jgi:predicted acylesterase/phospholipase RssA
MSSTKIENVLVLQGGGSLGAFACGVFKALANKNIKLDIVAGTSTGKTFCSFTTGVFSLFLRASLRPVY